jgi:hypothetical protein
MQSALSPQLMDGFSDDCRGIMLLSFIGIFIDFRCKNITISPFPEISIVKKHSDPEILIQTF